MCVTDRIRIHIKNKFLRKSILNTTNKDNQKLKVNKEELKAEKLPPCSACKTLINSFLKGLEKTSRGKFEGGDSSWEEYNLGAYAKSEIRLTEIQENLCKEVERGENQCHLLSHELETIIEDWWFNQQDSQPDIFNYVCIEKTQKCCPKNHYGPNCTPCQGYPDKVCNNNGKCKGAGTRKGNGSCLCDIGYTGDTCSQCVIGYYESYKDDDKLLCSPCHFACDGLCKGAGPKDCTKCAKGWSMMKDKGCYDINECLDESKFCTKDQFCVNNEGSYSCLACDKACKGCTGDGPDMCIHCADDYYKNDNLCINSEVLRRKKQERLTRYGTYLGLCIATCIIFQRNIYAASVIGLLVALYISVSEYVIARSSVQSIITSM
ncbi:cysteine-rich with EGF-like domain protein 2 [Prorops nasuta]|uniref:cysteine-rich with EGF-like domain protein 2 n=1 Tax=Prorops nasuta TaxID=863751 RepID=UPI0034CEF305